MENYKRERESKSNLEDSIKTKNKKSKLLNVNAWCEFKIDELFDVCGSKTTPIKELETFGFGNYPYVTTKATNNGVDGFFDCKTENGICLTIDSAVLGYCTYQPISFSASDHVEVLRPKFNMNKYIALFLVTLINKDTYRYSYGRKRNQKQIRRDIIRLPVDSNGMPDWLYMEKYIKSLPFGDKI